MPDRSDEVFKRKRQQCPECRGMIPDAYIEQNPFPEFPCPACGALIATSSMKGVEFTTGDERSEDRLHATLKVSYDSYHDFIIEYTKDVSKGGIFINTKRHHKINDIVDLSLNVPGFDKPLKIKGEVIHIKIQNVPDEEAGIGVKFVDIDPESRKALIAFMKIQNDFK
ncbi:MAG: type pilus assembly PilZ [Nitrospirae bacterium]|nr:type pilus assembly PilZ [Nitrospirota bacterium]